MKKFLLVAVAALAVVACKKDDNNNSGEQPTPPTPQAPIADQGSVPTTVDFTYPKSLVITTENATGVSSRTITYTVDSARKLLTKIAFSDMTGDFTFNYDANKLLTSVVTTGQSYAFSYDAKGLLTKLELSGSQTATYQYTHNAEGKVVSATSKADIGIPGQFDEHDYTYDYSIANKVVVTDKDHDPDYPTNTYTYTLESGNLVKFEGSNAGTTTYGGYDSKLNLESKSPFYLFNTHGSFSVYGDPFNFIKSKNNPMTKQWNATGRSTNSTYSYEYNGNVVTKSVEVQTGGLGGTTTITTVYNY